MLVALVIQLFGFLRLPEAFSAQALARMSQQRLMDASIIRRLTVKATYAEIVALYRVTMNAPPHNLPPRYNVCPTDTAGARTRHHALGPCTVVVEQTA